MALVGDHHIPQASLLRQLYYWPPFRDFLAELLGLEALHPFADPCQAINISVLGAGGCQPWHFDSAAFTVTLMLQAAHSGGHFEYAPGVRAPDDQNYAGVAAVLAGVREGVCTLALEPGTLSIFRGEESLHRVSPVEGDCLRLLATYLFDLAPDRTAVWATNLSLYGPSAEEAMIEAGMRAGDESG
jgi:hypothetical protein